MKKIFFKALAIAAILTATTSCNTKSEANEPQSTTISEYVSEYDYSKIEGYTYCTGHKKLNVDIFKHVIGYSKSESEINPELNEYTMTISIPELNVYDTITISEEWYRFVDQIFEDHLNVYLTYFYDKDEEYVSYYTWGSRDHKDITNSFIASVTLKH